MKLLVDAGNSRIKWATLEGNQLGPMQVAALEAGAALPESLWSPVRPERVVVANVAGKRVAGAIRDESKRRWNVDARFVVATEQAFGVQNAYADPAQLGADRWAAMVGAYAEVGGPVCVIDAGTALTIDVLAGDGQHLGGLITPGLGLMIGSLRQRTSDIAALERVPAGSEPRMLANNTADALRIGALHALAALVERVVAQTETRLAQSAQVVMTGGDAERIQAALGRPATYNAALVLRGLAEFARG